MLKLMLKHPALLRRAGYTLLALGLLCAAVLGASAWRRSGYVRDLAPASQAQKAEARRKYYARVRDGVGTEVELTHDSSPAQIRAAVNSVTKFVEARSGVSLGEATKERLAVLEAKVQSGAGRRLTLDTYSAALSATVLERFSSLTDEDIAQMDETLRGFKAPDLPESFDHSFKLPQGFVSISIPPEKNIATLKVVRDQLNSPARDVWADMFREKVLYYVRGKAENLAEAVPEQFGNLSDAANGRESSGATAGFTPLQAFLFAYSLVSDDRLDYGQANLRKSMEAKQKYWAKQLGRPFPSLDGRHAYGVNGYVFSSPLDLFFDDQNVNRLLDRIEKAGSA
ncbi:MAG TPA: hypothetical protein VE969_10305 [Pyrinomonadaceae bacterium]|nr:hypothetical protein [Pyrinomonadaceae bacterium]